MPSDLVADLLGDPKACYRVVSSRDGRWDGRLYLGVVSTGVYCRPSCSALTPKPENCRYYPSGSAAVAAGFRACRRCRPDALPGSRDHDHRGDLVGRALRLIRDGAVDERGVAGLAALLNVSERHLTRVLTAEVGVGPARLASSRRAQLARLLIEQSTMGMADVAFTAGFASIRQFNDVMRAEFGRPPSALRTPPRASDRQPVTHGSGLTLRLPYREPYAADLMWAYLGARLVPGIEHLACDATMERSIRAQSGAGRVWVHRPSAGLVRVRLDLQDLGDLGSAVASVRRWLDLDADPAVVTSTLQLDPGLAGLVDAAPGLRVPGALDGFELAVRAVVGQQVSVAGARTMLGRVAAAVGDRGMFPSAAQVVDGGPGALAGLGLTGRRVDTLVNLASAVADGTLALDPGADRIEARRLLRAIPGIGPWTADYVALRALGDPDAWPGTDLVLARRVRADGLDPSRWRPWRGYAAMYLWTDTSKEPR